MNALYLRPPGKTLADLPRPDFERVLSFAQLMMLKKFCPRALQNYRENAPKVPKNKFQRVGDATHRAAKMRPGAARDRFVEDVVKRLPEADRAKSAEVIKACLAADTKLDTKPVVHKQVDRRLFRCPGPLWPWELCAKPDESGEVLDTGTSRMVYRLVEKKTASVMRHETRRQIFFAGMVASLDPMLNFRGSIMLVVRLLRSGREVPPMWYSRKRTDEQMWELVPVLREIEGYLAAGGDFPTRTGDHCHDCPYRHNCEAYAQMQASRQPAVGELPLVQLTVAGQQPVAVADAVEGGSRTDEEKAAGDGVPVTDEVKATVGGASVTEAVMDTVGGVRATDDVKIAGDGVSSTENVTPHRYALPMVS